MLLVMCMASPAEVLTAARLLRHTEATPNASRLFRAPVAAGMRPRAVACMVWAQAPCQPEVCNRQSGDRPQKEKVPERVRMHGVAAALPRLACYLSVVLPSATGGTT